MINIYGFFADWRNEDVKFLADHGITVSKGYASFTVPEGKVFEKIRDHYTRRNFLFSKKPKEFEYKKARASFDKQDLDHSTNYILSASGEHKCYPIPPSKNSDVDKYFYNTVCPKCGVYDYQTRPIAINREPKLKANQKTFTSHWLSDVMFVEKKFFQEVFEPLGLTSMPILIGKSERVSEKYVQLIIPECPENLNFDNTEYDINKPCEVCNVKKYSQQVLDYYPSFNPEYEFLIYRTKESFGEDITHQAFRRLIISEKFCQILLEHNIIKYDDIHLYPFEKARS